MGGQGRKGNYSLDCIVLVPSMRGNHDGKPLENTVKLIDSLPCMEIAWKTMVNSTDSLICVEIVVENCKPDMEKCRKYGKLICRFPSMRGKNIWNIPFHARMKLRLTIYVREKPRAVLTVYG